MHEATTRTSWWDVVAVSAAAGAIGLVTWIATMASAPRYSSGVQEDMGSAALYPVLLCAAVVGGFVLPRHARLIGLMLGLPGLVLSPWTAPRGDDDGLWLLVVPLMAVFVLVLVMGARVAAWLRARVTAAAKPGKP